MSSIKIVGMEKLQKALKENVTLDDVKKVVKHHGSELQSRMQDKADFSKGYQTGTTKRSIFLEIEDSGFTASIGPGDTPLNPETGLPATEYSPYLEYGTRFMEAQPFVKPAFEEQAKEFQSDMKKLTK